MRSTVVTVLGVCLLIWSTDARAGVRWPSVREAPKDAQLAETGLRPSVALADFSLQPVAESDRERRESERTRALVAVLVTVIVGLGIGHMVAGDVPRGLMFMALELALPIVAVAVIFVAWGAAISAGTAISPAVIPLMWIPLLVLSIGNLAVRIWEIVDIVFRTGIAKRSSDTEEAWITVDRRAPRGAPPGIQPAFANAIDIRF